MVENTHFYNVELFMRYQTQDQEKIPIEFNTLFTLAALTRSDYKSEISRVFVKFLQVIRSIPGQKKEEK